jgi:NAD(P)-dependent dehydrogenase (short-subunit alcohol dehydrogenase family)
VGAATDSTVRRFGKIDILVNNAGIAGVAKKLWECTPEEWFQVLNLDLYGVYVCCHAIVPKMLEKNYGRIVNIASIAGQRAGTNRTSYGTSKAALIQLTRQMALELAPHRITANAIAPGPVETDMVRAAHTPAQRAAYGRMVPAQRYGTPAEVAAAALFLVSDEAAYVTGHVLDVDGGFMAAGLVTRD